MNQKNKSSLETTKVIANEKKTKKKTNLDSDLSKAIVVLGHEDVKELFESKNSLKLNKSQMLDDDFEIDIDSSLVKSPIDFDPKSLYTKSLQTKRKPQIYSTLRTTLIVLGLVVFVLLSAVSIAYNISEFENPEFAGREMVKDISEVINPNLREPIPQLQRPRLGDQNPNSQLPLPPQVIQKIEQRREIRREVNLVTRVLGLSFEFTIIASILTLLSYLIYRHTDWPFVKNKLLLACLIVLVSVTISVGFWVLFKQDQRVPQALRSHRDFLRGTVVNRTVNISSMTN
jgi:hypothetical protein